MKLPNIFIGFYIAKDSKIKSKEGWYIHRAQVIETSLEHKQIKDKAISGG